MFKLSSLMPSIPSRDDFIFSIKTFGGAMLSFYIAFKLGLPRPFWAPLAAYVASQPFAGATRSKAFYRIIGSIIGSIGTVTLIPLFINYSLVLSLVLGLWFAFWLFLSLQDRTPRAYAFMLGGYTIGFISMPAMANVDTLNITTIFDIGIARVEEIGVGVLCAALFHSVFLPKSAGSVVLGRLDGLLKNVHDAIVHILQNTTGADNRPDLNKIAQTITELRILSTHLPFDTSNLRWVNNIVRSMQDRLSYLVPVISSIEDRLRELYSIRSGTLPPELQQSIDDIVDWLNSPDRHDAARAIRLRKKLDTNIPKMAGTPQWEDMLTANLVGELYRLVDIAEDCFDLRRQVDRGLAGIMPVKEEKQRKVSTLTLNIDRRMTLMSATAAFMSVFVSCLFWVASGWPSGFACPMMAGMYFLFFAGFDNPVPMLKGQIWYTILSGIPAGLYLLWIMPSAHSFEMVMLTFAPFFIWCGAYLTKPQTALKMIPFFFTTMATLTMFDMGSANATSFMNAQISQALGILFSALFMLVFRSISLETMIGHLVESIWTDIANIGKADRPPSPVAVTVRMVDGVSLIAPRLAILQKAAEPTRGGLESAKNILADIRIGLNMTRLLRTEEKLSRQNISIRPVIAHIGDLYENKKAVDDATKDKLLAEIDDTMQSIASSPQFGLLVNQSIASLAAIRKDLFPDAKPYVPSTFATK